MSPLVKNGYFCISVVVFTILPWLLLHKMKTKADKDVGMRGGSGRQEEWEEENGKEKYVLSIRNVIVSTISLCITPLRATFLLGTLSSYTVHISHSHPWILALWKALCGGGDTHYLNSRNFSPWLFSLLVYKFVFGQQWKLKHCISIIIPFYSFLHPKFPNQPYLPGLCFCAKYFQVT